MPEMDRATKIATGLNERRKKLSEQLKAMNSIGLGNERLSPREFKSRIEKDKEYRLALAQKIGGRAVARIMTGDVNLEESPDANSAA